MEIHHKVKPLHGWREFLGEVGIVVLGVMIALGAEQVAEAIHWEGQVRSAHDALREEMSSNIGKGLERLRLYRCVEQRLNEISRIVDEADRTHRLPPLGDIGYPPSKAWSRGVWDGVLAGQTAAHLRPEELLFLGDFYADVAEMAHANIAEMEAWSDISQVVGPGRPFNSVSAQAIRAAIGHARYYNRFEAIDGLALMGDIRASPIAMNAQVIRAFADEPLGQAHSCRPISRVIPSTYGQAPWDKVVGPAVDQIRERLREPQPH